MCLLLYCKNNYINDYIQALFPSLYEIPILKFEIKMTILIIPAAKIGWSRELFVRNIF